VPHHQLIRRRPTLKIKQLPVVLRSFVQNWLSTKRPSFATANQVVTLTLGPMNARVIGLTCSVQFSFCSCDLSKPSVSLRLLSEEVLFELIKSKCLPILLYGNDVCPMNSAYRHSLQFTINKIMYKIFGAMSKGLYIEISAHFGIESVENLIADRRNRFINRY